jgi:hypothetical protein
MPAQGFFLSTDPKIKNKVLVGVMLALHDAACPIKFAETRTATILKIARQMKLQSKSVLDN